MDYSICLLSTASVRLESSDRSEMISQMLFGELAEKIDEEEKWWKIRTLHDSYEGWIDKKQLSCLSRDEYQLLIESEKLVCADLIQIIEDKNTSQLFPILIGSSLPNLINGIMHIGNRKYAVSGNIINTREKPCRNLISDQAMLYLNSPYQWGGRSPFGIDCSGFVQVVFKQTGLHLKRDASFQAKQGETVNFLTESLPGDIAFFDNEEEQISHVGILLGDNKIIHASGKVRVDAIDHHGIFNYDIKRYTHKLRLIKRFLPLF